MVVIRECDDFGRKIHLRDEERKILFEECMREMSDVKGVTDLKRVTARVCAEVFTSESDSDPDSSGSVELIMETNRLIKGEAVGFKRSLIQDEEIAALRSLWCISTTGDEDDVILESCEPGESVCMIRPQGAETEWFYFYTGVIEEFGIQFPLSDFETDILRTINLAPSQLRPNSWGFIRAFEIICRALSISPTIGLFFSFFEIKSTEPGNWVAISGIPKRSFLQAYTSNFKGYKERFLRVRCGPRCPYVIYGTDGHHKFPLYWTCDPLPISGFVYDRLSDSEILSLEILDSFRPIRVKDLLALSPEEVPDFLGKNFWTIFILLCLICYLTSFPYFISNRQND